MANKNHPECKPDEVYLMNAYVVELRSNYKTLRIGMIPYDIHGNVVKFYEKSNFRPVFVKEWEYLEVANNG